MAARQLQVVNQVLDLLLCVPGVLTPAARNILVHKRLVSAALHYLTATEIGVLTHQVFPGIRYGQGQG